MNWEIEKNIWHPYSRPEITNCLKVVQAKGNYLYLENGKKVLDAISSWWSVAFGHNNMELTKALREQSYNLCHVMFAGLTHNPVQNLTAELKDLLKNRYSTFFYSDSGSVAVEVALKMAIQAQYAYGRKKTQFLSFINDYHGDTLGAMSVTSPEVGMHSIFSTKENIFFPAPPNLKDNVIHNNNNSTPVFTTEEEIEFNHYLNNLEILLKEKASNLAALIIEPIIQGAGGMKFYDFRYLSSIIKLCHKYELFVIIDEIATGFGRTEKDFAIDYLEDDALPDIITLGKALTGGHISLGVTCTTDKITSVISSHEPRAFMHGPTFMANPLACTIAYNAVKLYKSNFSIESNNKIAPNFKKYYGEIKDKILKIQNKELKEKLLDVRFIGPIFVVEFSDKINVEAIQDFFINKNIWLRPFGNIIYFLPPYTITEDELEYLCSTLYQLIEAHLELIYSKTEDAKLDINYV